MHTLQSTHRKQCIFILAEEAGSWHCGDEEKHNCLTATETKEGSLQCGKTAECTLAARRLQKMSQALRHVVTSTSTRVL